MAKKAYLIIFVLLALLPAVPAMGVEQWEELAVEIEGKLDEALATYRLENSTGAKGLVSSAYFDLFEERGMETAVSIHISTARKTELESGFGSIRAAISAGKEPAEVELRIRSLGALLHETARSLSAATGAAGPGDPADSGYPIALLFNSFIIIVREGFEAILVISALAAYLFKSGNRKKVKTVYGGAGAAIVASVVAAILLQSVFDISGANREALEGIVMLTATAVLFYVSYWLLSKMEVRRWQNYIKGKVEGSLTRGSLFTLWFAAFLAVFREGAETILFYQALYTSSGGDVATIATGFVSGSIVLVGIFLVVKYGSMVIPIGPFFAVTSLFLYYLAFNFAGQGIRELQEAGWISAAIIEGFPEVPLLGLYPTWQGLTLQGVLLLSLVVAIVYGVLVKPYRERAAAEGDLTHIEDDMKAIHDMLEDVCGHALKCRSLVRGRDEGETSEINLHLESLDTLVHEVAGHLKKLEKGMQDVFTEMERDIKKAR